MKADTRDIDLADARDLLARLPRACLAFATEQGPQVQPVVLLAQDNGYPVGVAVKTGQQPGLGQEAVLLVDEGVHYFELRSIYIRGHAQPADAPKGASSD